MDLVFSPRHIETWRIDRLRPYARNAKQHGNDQVAKIAASMAKFGWTVPCMVADDGELIAGHGRVLAATMLGLDQYDDAELDRKKVAAMHAMFVTSLAPESPLSPPDDDGMGGLEISPGQVVRLDLGEDVTVGQPADSVATYEPFQYRTLL